MNVISRKDAKAAGLNRYFTGKPCKYGHTALRRSYSGHCVSCETISAREWRAANLERARARDRRHHHASLPKPTRPRPLTCEVCDRPPKKNALNLDHCHVTHRFRGWLCVACNMAIGKLGDNVESLQRAVAYLEQFEQSLPQEP